jgi:pilus assembly protein CpaF
MGPLAPLMADPEITDILVNGSQEVWIDRHGKLTRTDIRFDDESHLRRLLDRIVDAHGRTLDSRTPMVDVRLSDGSRVHAVIPPLCAKGTIVSIRRFRIEALTADQLVASGFLNQPMLELLAAFVRCGVNIVVAGGAGAGKTTLVNLLAQFIPANERIVTVEETSELRLQHDHVIPLECRTENAEKTGGVNLRDLVRTALRMRADRIIVGEVRGSEVLDMLQAMNIGHDGSLTTVHANSPRDVLRRLESLALMGDDGITRDSIREMIGSAVSVIVQLCRFSDGSRRVISISEVVEEDGALRVQELFGYRPTQSGESASQGKHFATDTPSTSLELAARRGFDVGHIIASRAAQREATHEC